MSPDLIFSRFIQHMFCGKHQDLHVFYLHSYEECKDSVKNMNKEKSPGLDVQKR